MCVGVLAAASWEVQVGGIVGAGRSNGRGTEIDSSAQASSIKRPQDAAQTASPTRQAVDVRRSPAPYTTHHMHTAHHTHHTLQLAQERCSVPAAVNANCAWSHRLCGHPRGHGQLRPKMDLLALCPRGRGHVPEAVRRSPQPRDDQRPRILHVGFALEGRRGLQHS